jgi:regulator of protease activity HflC (stomatin/prohibitin superfamily)
VTSAALSGPSPPPTPAQFYKLTNSHSQISSYVFDVVRASVPKMNLDDVFLEKEAIARSIRNVRAA